MLCRLMRRSDDSDSKIHILQSDQRCFGTEMSDTRWSVLRTGSKWFSCDRTIYSDAALFFIPLSVSMKHTHTQIRCRYVFAWALEHVKLDKLFSALAFSTSEWMPYDKVSKYIIKKKALLTLHEPFNHISQQINGNNNNRSS